MISRLVNTSALMKCVDLTALNQLSCSQANLLSLRLLNCSDLCFHFMLLKPSTVKDIIHNCLELLQMDLEEGTHNMSPEEHIEFHSLIGNMAQFSQQVDN